MAYDNRPDYEASRILHYANPSVIFDGTPTGAADGSDFNDNAHPLFGLVDPVYEPLGYNGSNSQLGARNAQTFLETSGSNGIVPASNRDTRSAPEVTSPTNSDSWLAGTTQTITFLGGDMEYTATFELWKNGSYLMDVPGTFDAIDHQAQWTIPMLLAGGTDYQIRMTGNALRQLNTFGVPRLDCLHDARGLRSLQRQSFSKRHRNRTRIWARNHHRGQADPIQSRQVGDPGNTHLF